MKYFLLAVRFLFLLFVFMLLSFAIARLGGYPFGHHIKFGVYLFYGFLVTYWLKHAALRHKALWWAAFLLPNVAFAVWYFYTIHFQFFQLAVPSTLAFFMGLAAGWVVDKRTFYPVLVFLALLSWWVYKDGYAYWLNKLNQGTYTGKLNNAERKKLDIFLTDSKGHPVDLSGPDVYYVLDFWSSSCGECFREFPVYEKFYHEIKDNPRIRFYAVNVPRHPMDDLKEYENLVKDYTFPVVFYSVDRKTLLEKTDINAFPTLLVVKNDTVIFRGRSHTFMKFYRRYLK